MYTLPCSFFSLLMNMGAPTSRRSVTPSLSTSKEHSTLPKYDPIWENAWQPTVSLSGLCLERKAVLAAYLFPSFRVDDGQLFLGIDGVDYNLSRVVGARCACHKVFCGPIAHCGDGVAWNREHRI